MTTLIVTRDLLERLERDLQRLEQLIATIDGYLECGERIDAIRDRLLDLHAQRVAAQQVQINALRDLVDMLIAKVGP